ncbi:MAG: ABC transporter permease [Sphaerobacter sp.]|nr:ABC transporter permease [Sphaerobacter sp.]
MTSLAHTWHMTGRHLRNFSRQPWYIAFSLVQPVIYLLLFGALFKRVVELPGFATTSYVTYLTPGIVVMSALFSGGWLGVSVITDLERGVLDRFLVSPVWRGALIIGRVLQTALVTVIQSLILIGLGLLVGARFAGGAAQLVALIAAAMLLTAIFGALSCAVALALRKEESIIGVVQFLLLPLTFLSSVFMAPALMPGWMRQLARVNPLNWAVELGRAQPTAGDGSLLLSRGVALLALAAVATWLATRALRAYQRSL